MHVEVQHAVYASVPNTRGSLARASATLAQSRVNVDSVAFETHDGEAFLRVLTHRPHEAVAALREGGFAAFESEVAIAALHNHPGELARALSELDAAGLHVEALVTTREGHVAFRTADASRAAAILRKL